jgi:hypothetical protein
MYTYGRNARTHYSILVLVKRLLTLLETTTMTAPKALILLSDDEQIHPVLRANIKEAQSRATKDVGVWSLFWIKEDIFNFMLRNIMLNCYSSDSQQVLRSVLSLAAFEEEKLPFSTTYEERYETKKDYDAWLI